jgi:lysophospholipase L1-like esterase/azurin
MVERLLEEGFLEAGLQLAYPELGLRVRSLAWTGDEVAHRRRPEGYSEHLKSLLAAWPADVVVLGYGFNESFAGTDGLADFRRQYEVLLGEMARRHPGARLVLLAPHAVEERSAPAGAARNADVAAYAAVVRELAAARGARFIDLFATSREAFARAARPLTDLGVNLNPEGARVLGLAVAAALAGPGGLSPVEPPRLEEVARAAARRHAHAAELVRPKNGALYYGVRRRPEEAAAELPRYHELVRQAEAVVHALAKRPGVSAFARPGVSPVEPPGVSVVEPPGVSVVEPPGVSVVEPPVENLPPLAPGKVTPYRFPGGNVRASRDLQAEIVVAEGYALNLFASEEQFPELRNPVQLSFDARGRLWVVTMPSFPHTIPGERPADKILVLEDRDRDGRADTCTVFAEGLDALDGVAFHERGVIVSAQPRLLILQDTDGDGRADTRTELLRGVDVTDSHHGGMVVSDPLGHLLFCDGVFHRSQFETPFGVVRGIDSTTYRLDPRTGRVGTEWQSQTPNPWKVAFTAQGQPLQRYGGGHLLDGLPLTWTPLGVYHPYGHGTVLNYGKGSALAVISSPNFPPELQPGVATAALLGSYQVSLSAVRADEGPLTASSRVDVLTSKNSTFRPVDVEFGLDGALYVSDFSSLIIGHAQHAMRDPQWNHERGRIWRVVHRGRPVARDWPRIEGADAGQLAALLDHPQDLVRHHARIELRKLGAPAVPAVERVAQPGGASDRVRLEACWVLLALGEVRPAWLDALARSPDPLVRAAVPALVRFGVERLPDAAARLGLAAADPNPRVRMAAVNAVAHLRAARPALEAALARMPAAEPAVARMREDLKAGTAPRIGRAVPVLEVAPETRVGHWQEVGAARPTEEPPPATGDARKKAKASGLMTRTFRTFVEVAEAQPAVLGVRHAFLEISANGVQVHSADSQYSADQQAEFPLRAGLNQVEITYRRLRAAPPPVFLYDPTGRPVPGARLAPDAATLTGWAQRWEAEHGVGEGVLRVQAVPNQMQFAPTELRVRAGQPVRLVFENPDLMPHNLLLTAPGADEEVGALADLMAAEPGALARHYVPASPRILHATPLVEPGRRAELAFTAPATPGRYPYLCTFPGHWRMMRGILIVE